MKKILIAYATRGGSTADTASIISREISSQNDITVDVISVKKVTDITSYDAIILGSAVWMGKPLPEMLSFIKSYQPILRSKKVACFVMCMGIHKETEKNINESNAYLKQFIALCSPVDSRVFAGKVDSSKLGFFARIILKMVKTPEGDFRKIDKIKEWAKDVIVKLTN